jgi:hypothetical protein
VSPSEWHGIALDAIEALADELPQLRVSGTPLRRVLPGTQDINSQNEDAGAESCHHFRLATGDVRGSVGRVRDMTDAVTNHVYAPGVMTTGTRPCRT